MSLLAAVNANWNGTKIDATADVQAVASVGKIHNPSVTLNHIIGNSDFVVDGSDGTGVGCDTLDDAIASCTGRSLGSVHRGLLNVSS